MPIRIQRRRTKGWRMPDNTVNVSRPGRWGNPYQVEVFGRALAMQLFRNTINGTWNPGLLDGRTDAACDAAYEAHRRFLKRIGGHPLECVSELRGKNLACWCATTDSCHADILLDLANPPGSCLGSGG